MIDKDDASNMSISILRARHGGRWPTMPEREPDSIFVCLLPNKNSRHVRAWMFSWGENLSYCLFSFVAHENPVVFIAMLRSDHLVLVSCNDKAATLGENLKLHIERVPLVDISGFCGQIVSCMVDLAAEKALCGDAHGFDRSS